MVIWSGKAWKSAAVGGGRGNVGTSPPVEEDEDMVDYLTGTEQDTGDTIDGATLYAKFIDFGNLPNNGTKSVAHNITTLADVYSYELIMDSTTQQWPLTWTTGTSYANIRVDQTNISVITNQNFSALTGRAWLIYTKV